MRGIRNGYDLLNSHLYTETKILQIEWLKYTVIQVSCKKTLVLNFHLLKPKHWEQLATHDLPMEPNHHARFHNPAWFLASLSTWFLGNSLRQNTLGPSTALWTQEFLETTMMPSYNVKLSQSSYPLKFDMLMNINQGSWDPWHKEI